MRKILPFISASFLVMVIACSYGSTHNVAINDNGFLPNNFTANVGDSVIWTASTYNYYSHNVASTSVPSGAATFSSAALSAGQTYNYIIVIAGSYGFQSTSYNTFTGSFTASGALDISNVSTKIPGLVFQNPFRDHLDICSGQPGVISVYDILGKKVAETNLYDTDHPAEINTAGLYNGIYFILFSIEGKVVETYKAMKEN